MPKTMQPDSPFPTPPPPCNPNPNPNPYQPLQALHFLHLLARINGSGSNSSTTDTPAAISIRRRSLCIRRAAYASMAYAVGPRRAWSRALLRRLRRGGRARHAPAARRVRRAGRVMVVTSGGSKPVWENTRAGELRQLVPGGRGMDICSLLDETRHYIQCLSSQDPQKSGEGRKSVTDRNQELEKGIKKKAKMVELGFFTDFSDLGKK